MNPSIKERLRQDTPRAAGKMPVPLLALSPYC